MDDVLSKSGLSEDVQVEFFAGFSDFENINEFILKITDLKEEALSISDADIAKGVISQEDLILLNTTIARFQAMGIAIKNAGDSAKEVRLDKQIAQWKKFSGELLGVIDNMSGVNDAFGDDLAESTKRAIEGLKGATSGAVTAITQIGVLSANSVKVAAEGAKAGISGREGVCNISYNISSDASCAGDSEYTRISRG